MKKLNVACNRCELENLLKWIKSMRNILFLLLLKILWQCVKALMKSETIKPGIVQNKIEQSPCPEQNIMFWFNNNSDQ